MSALHKIEVELWVPEEQVDALVEELETASIEAEGITVRTAGGSFTVEVDGVKEATA